MLSKTYHEVVGNVHIHTRRSDGAGTHAEVARAAQQAGLNFVIPTDHNVLAVEEEGWRDGVLMLIGEETNDPLPPKASHYLAFGIREDVAGFSADPQALIDEVRRQGGFGFIAHPCERPGLFINEPALSWHHWDVNGYVGISIWNYMSEFKSYLWNLPAALWAVYFPHTLIRGPFPESLALYDRLLAAGRRVPLIGTSDAHANTYAAGPWKRVVFPYTYLFRTVNLHLLLPSPLQGELEADRYLIYEAMMAGRGFIGYHLLGNPRGFSFVAHTGQSGTLTYGQEANGFDGSVQFVVQSPLPARLRLLRDGVLVKQTFGRQMTYRAAQPGVYRVEAYRWAWLRWRGWVFTNPIYIRL